MKRITVLLADDNKFVRREFRRILEHEDDLEVVGEAKNGREAVALVKKLRPALVLMDLAMPVLNGLRATAQIFKAALATKVLMLSAHSDDGYVQEAINAGAMGYLIKQTSAGSVCTAIREVQKGNTFFSPSIPSRLRKPNRKKSKGSLPAYFRPLKGASRGRGRVMAADRGISLPKMQREAQPEQQTGLS